MEILTYILKNWVKIVKATQNKCKWKLLNNLQPFLIHVGARFERLQIPPEGVRVSPKGSLYKHKIWLYSILGESKTTDLFP